MTQWMKICMPIRKYGESELIWPCLVSNMVEKSISVYILFCILLIVVFVYNILTCILVWITLWFFYVKIFNCIICSLLICTDCFVSHHRETWGCFFNLRILKLVNDKYIHSSINHIQKIVVSELHST